MNAYDQRTRTKKIGRFLFAMVVWAIFLAFMAGAGFIVYNLFFT